MVEVTSSHPRLIRLSEIVIVDRSIIKHAFLTQDSSQNRIVHITFHDDTSLDIGISGRHEAVALIDKIEGQLH